jgi:hypothetical protein
MSGQAKASYFKDADSDVILSQFQSCVGVILSYLYSLLKLNRNCYDAKHWLVYALFKAEKYVLVFVLQCKIYDPRSLD